MPPPHASAPCSIEGSTLRIDSFDATIHPITPNDIALLHELTVGVFWPHRRCDLEFIVGLGRGSLALDAIGRVMGSAMLFRTDTNLCTLGMMVTAPRLQTHGTGSVLLGRLMEAEPQADFRLSATRSGYRLYERAGFIPIDVIRQHQGIARTIHAPDLPAGVTVRALEAADLPALRALDTDAYGCSRTAILDATLSISDGVVAERDGGVAGYALCRSFGRGDLIGPVVAADDRMAMGLAYPFIVRRTGMFLRADTPAAGEEFGAFLAAAGLGVFDTLTEMYTGRQRRPLDGTRIFGLAMQSLG